MLATIMNIIIIGQAGSGKGTQAELLAKKFNLEHIDMGAALRNLAKNDSELGKEINEIINVRKELVPSRIMKEALHVKLGSFPREKGIVFDGVPRNLEQAGYLEEALREVGRKIDQVFFIRIPKEESLKRISGRFVCRNCKSAYIKYDTGEKSCQKCGGELIQRIDDTPEGIEKRLRVFEKETIPVLNHFRKKRVLTEVNGMKEVVEVFRDIIASINK